eukprot:TRINITY_DN8624_c0_g1_i3.p1 TRINITY_DN8624_c0_g1~~TRINITY_DN8624_c0_g1_i3.p1  ORF type:complete len:461 (+),score=125.60 TRINITY_DN8624_c0_g1_i3:141-1523(+)
MSQLQIAHKLRAFLPARPNSHKNLALHSRVKRSASINSSKNKVLRPLIQKPCAVPLSPNIKWLIEKIVSRTKVDFPLKLTSLRQIKKLLKESSSNGKLMVSYFGKNNWAFARFLRDCDNAEWRENLLEVIRILVTQLISSKSLWSENVLGNITNKPRKPAFARADCIAFIHDNGLNKLLAEAFTLGFDAKFLLSILKDLCTLAQMCNERIIYDMLAEKMLAAGTFTELLRLLESKYRFQPAEELWVIKILELAATLPQGVLLLSHHLGTILPLLHRNLVKPGNESMQPIAMLLLDLTANENCIEEVAEFLVKRKAFPWILAELRKELSKTERTKYKDILMGIVLNLSCNIESEEMQRHFLKLNTPRILVEILFDSRNDWPSNGSSLALMQYARRSLEDYRIYQVMNEEGIKDGMRRYLGLEGLAKAKENIREALNYLEITDEKEKSIRDIMAKLLIAPAA